ncbi:hypothetical protein MCRH_1814 [Moraxella catarrhalis RH4]|nr:hypothetical protein MCRH_1814 [Moraxella catarrhalis RH4]
MAFGWIGSVQCHFRAVYLLADDPKIMHQIHQISPETTAH